MSFRSMHTQFSHALSRTRTLILNLTLQMTYNASLLPHLRAAAMEALRGMDRKPITDPASMH